MRRPSELTDDEAAAEADYLYERLREADREDAALFIEQSFINTATEAELREVFAAEEVSDILHQGDSHKAITATRPE